MTDDRRLAFAAGALYLVTFLSSIPAVFLLDPVLNDPVYIVSAGEDTRVTLGATLDLVNALACIGTAVALYPVVRTAEQALAMGFVTSRMLEAAVIVIGVVSILAVVTLRQAGAGGGDPGHACHGGPALVAVRDWTFIIGPGLMPGINARCWDSLLYRSRLVPRVIPVLGLIGAPLLISSAMGKLWCIERFRSTGIFKPRPSSSRASPTTPTRPYPAASILRADEEQSANAISFLCALLLGCLHSVVAESTSERFRSRRPHHW